MMAANALQALNATQPIASLASASPTAPLYTQVDHI
jgi:hypothetical protein